MKIDWTLSKDESVKCGRAIVFYGHPHQVSKGIASVHDVTLGENRTPTILPGRLLTMEGLREALRDVSATPQRRLILPERALSYDSGRLVWWSPSAKRPIFFRTSDNKFNNAMNGKTVSHAPLVFHAEAGRLHVYALQQDVRPTEETPLCRAPYFNLYGAGNMCTGNVRMPEIAVPSEISLWERAFFESNFTHTNAGTVVKFEGGHNALWQHLSKTGEPFPTNALIPLKDEKGAITLERMVNE
jgi:PRTRC genetic system protein B